MSKLVSQSQIDPDKIISEFCYSLTIRQELAARFMSAMISHDTRYRPRKGASNNWHEAISEEAFELADAFIEESKK